MGRVLLSLPLLLLLLAPAANAQTVPNIFTDGTPALASEVNENFQALASAVNASDCATAADVVCNPSAVSCPACPSCPDCGSSDFYNQGFVDGGNGVDITSDNSALCTGAGGTYDAGTDSCTVDLTTDNAAAEAAAGNTACTQAGGTWDAGTSTCSAAPPPLAYDCFMGGHCGVDGHNVGNYAGATEESTGCSSQPNTSIQWLVGTTACVIIPNICSCCVAEVCGF